MSIRAKMTGLDASALIYFVIGTPGSTLAALQAAETWVNNRVDDLAPDFSADFNGDWSVDGSDFLIWQRNFGATNALLTAGDADRDGLVGAGDLAVWKEEFGLSLETFTGAPLTLKMGSGAYAGKLVSGENGEHYSDLTLDSIHDLAVEASANPTGPEGFMYNGNAGYTNTPLAGLNLALEIVSISPGLNLGHPGLNQSGDRLTIGGEATWPSEPVFWTDAGAAPSNDPAALRLVDLAGQFGNSGTFHIDFAVVPEPGSVGMALIAGLGFVVATYRWRRG